MIWADLVPILGPARDYVRKGIAPGGTHANRRFLSRWVGYAPEIAEWEQLLLCDAQTSGGLLAAVSGDVAPGVIRELHSTGAVSAALVGSIEAGEHGHIRVQRAPQSDPAARRGKLGE